MTAWTIEAARQVGRKPDEQRVREMRAAIATLLTRRPDGRCICMRIVSPRDPLDEPENHVPGCVVGEALRP